MKNIILFTFLTSMIVVQGQILAEKDIPKLNSIIKSLEKKYEKSSAPKLKSYEYASANYFEISKKDSEKFLASLKEKKSIDELLNEFPGLIVDRDLFVVKQTYDNNDKKYISISSFEIGKNSRRKIDIKYEDAVKQSANNYFYTTTINRMYIFLLNNEFKSNNIPKKYADWVHYTDVLIEPTTPVFLNSEDDSYRGLSFAPILDSLTEYFNKKTNRPRYVNCFKLKDENPDTWEEKCDAYNKKLNSWKDNKEKLADSLYRNDEHFKKLLNKSLLYVEKHNRSSSDLEDFTARLISKERALNIMRKHKVVGSCSFDNGPIVQQKRMAKLAAETQDWPLFIKTFLNVMNDNVSRVAYNNISFERGETYIDELKKLDLNINKILLGSNIRMENTEEKHYQSNNFRTAKAVAQMDTKNQDLFESDVVELLEDPLVDGYTKLNFYYLLSNYKDLLENKDSIRANNVNEKLHKVISFLPYEIKSRIENRNKQLYDLLYREKEDLDKFKVVFSGINFYDGYGWTARLKDKNTDDNIQYNLSMPIGDSITPLKNFTKQKDKLKSRVKNHKFLQEILKDNPEGILCIRFKKDKSLYDKDRSELPQKLRDTLDLDDAVSFFIQSPKGFVDYILLKNNTLLIASSIPEGFTIPGYKFEELHNGERDLLKMYISLKLFDENGKMLN